jgi:predicted transcriptional regulator
MFHPPIDFTNPWGAPIWAAGLYFFLCFLVVFAVWTVAFRFFAGPVLHMHGKRLNRRQVSLAEDILSSLYMSTGTPLKELADVLKIEPPPDTYYTYFTNIVELLFRKGFINEDEKSRDSYRLTKRGAEAQHKYLDRFLLAKRLKRISLFAFIAVYLPALIYSFRGFLLGKQFWSSQYTLTIVTGSVLALVGVLFGKLTSSRN